MTVMQSANIEAFMNKVFFNTPTMRDYSDITPYTAFTAAFPWATGVPA